MNKAVVLFSGGLDSTALLARAIKEFDLVHALSFDYGQRHGGAELRAAEDVARILAPHEWRLVNIPGVRDLLKGSSQTDDSVPVPLGHYAEESMKATVVPNRNMMMLAIATAYAISLRADAVGYAAHHGDHAIYPDCRPEFVNALGGAIGLADWHHVDLWAPFINKSKAEIVVEGMAHWAPLAMTWSCYSGGSVQCGRCGTCVERREAFAVAGLDDPTTYLEV